MFFFPTLYNFYTGLSIDSKYWYIRGGRGHDCIGSWIYNYLCISPLKVVSLNPVHGEVYLIQHYVINLVRDMRQVSDFLRVLVSSTNKLTATI